jgi:hypothetical protein
LPMNSRNGCSDFAELARRRNRAALRASYKSDAVLTFCSALDGVTI